MGNGTQIISLPTYSFTVVRVDFNTLCSVRVTITTPVDDHRFCRQPSGFLPFTFPEEKETGSLTSYLVGGETILYTFSRWHSFVLVSLSHFVLLHFSLSNLLCIWYRAKNECSAKSKFTYFRLIEHEWSRRTYHCRLIRVLFYKVFVTRPFFTSVICVVKSRIFNKIH